MKKQNTKTVNNKGIISENKSRQEIFLNAPKTDAGNAELFATLYKDEFRYVKESGSWMYFDGKVWREERRRAYNRIIEIGRQRRDMAAKLDVSDIPQHEIMEQIKWGLNMERDSYIENTLKAASNRDEFHTVIAQYDEDKYLLGVKNGVIDLNTGKFRQARPEDYITMQAGVEYVENAKATIWENFLIDVFNDDKELIRYIQKAVGYSLTGDTSEQIFFILLGEGENGKGVFQDILGKLMGDYAATANFETIEGGKGGEQTKNDVARLNGKRLVRISESDEGKYLNEARIKSLTGEDIQTARFLRQEYFEFVPVFKIWLATNHKPKIRNNDHAMWRRIILINFPMRFVANPRETNERKKDKKLRTKLEKMIPGILNWALEGLKMYRDEGLDDIPKAIAEATKEYRDESDVMGRWIEENLEKDSSAETPLQALYDDYVRWMQASGHIPKAKTEFGKEFSKRFSSRRGSRGMRIYVGVDIAEKWTEAFEEENPLKTKLRAA